jgi:hypothetical protein
MSELNSKLAEIQKNLNAPKNQYNKFGKYHYRSCEDILEGLKSVLGDCVLTISDKIIDVGNRIYVEATATITLGSESVSVTAYAREEENKKGMDSAQLTGSTSSYARKYALNGLFLIDDNKDADTNEVKNLSNNKPVVKKLSNETQEIVNLLASKNLDGIVNKWSGGAVSNSVWGELTLDQQNEINNILSAGNKS